MFRSHLQNGNRLNFNAYLWIRCWECWFAFDMLHSACAAIDELVVGLGSLPYFTFSRSQADVLTILHETMLMLFSRISQGSAIIWEISFLPFCRGLLPLVAEMLVIFRASRQHHAEHKLQWTSAVFCPSISHASLIFCIQFFSLFLTLTRSFTAEMLGILLWVIEMAWVGRKC